MAAETSKEAGEDQAESAIDDLIREILNESGTSTEPSARGGTTTAALIETAIASMRGSSQTSLLERVLVAEALASELAEALAPALAEQLAPRFLKALEQAARDGGEKEKAAEPTARSGGQGRKPQAR